MKNYLHEKRQLFIRRPLELKLLTLGKIWSKGVSRIWEELPNAFFEFSPAIILLEIIAIVCEKKSLFSRNLIFGDLWWPKYWPDLKMTLLKLWDLVAVYLTLFCLWLKNVVFEFGGGPKGPLHPKLNVSEPARNRVKRLRLLPEDIDSDYNPDSAATPA